MAGCTAAALLKEKHDVELWAPEIGGMCSDEGGVQLFGPHAFHTNNERVWEWVQQWSDWVPYVHRVFAVSLGGVHELPLDQDERFDGYSRKAWGMDFGQLPEEIQNRVPARRKPGTDGYHNAVHKAQPQDGFTAMLHRMVEGVQRFPQPWHRTEHHDGKTLVIYTGDINALEYADPLPWVGRVWSHMPGSLPHAQINYGGDYVPQLRSYDNATIAPHGRPVVSMEFHAGRETERRTPCYPVPGPDGRDKADWIIANAMEDAILPLGRMARYRYLNMDATIRMVMEELTHWELI